MAKQIAVIGGGVAGTAAANWLVKHGYGVTIFEQNSHVGGRVYSRLMRGIIVEMGAGFVTDAYPNLRAFIHESKLADQLDVQRSALGILSNGHVKMLSARTLVSNDPLPFGAKLCTIPLLLKTLIGWHNLGFDHSWKASKYDNRSVAVMFSGRGGKELIEYVLQPILNGYFYWSPEHTSEAAMLAVCKAAFSRNTYKMRTGLQRIPESLVQGSAVHLNSRVHEVVASENGYTVSFEQEGKGKTHKFDGIDCATTANKVTAIFPELLEKQIQFFCSINYSSTILVTEIYKTDRVVGSKSIAFPREEGLDLSSLTVASGIDSKGVPRVTIKTYASGAATKKLIHLSDKKLVEHFTKSTELIRSEIKIHKQAPLDVQIQRWTEALPLFDVGHLQRLHVFEVGKIESQDKPVVFAGDYIGGPFMEGAFTSGVHAAERLSLRL
jgi:oxygen-dependent protoporphyrinogen oxidase